MPKFRKKPVVIEAVQWTGDNTREVALWAVSDIADFALPTGWWIRAPADGVAEKQMMIHTLEGDHAANIGDWIIRGVKGEFYPCKPDIFAATYEAVE